MHYLTMVSMVFLPNGPASTGEFIRRIFWMWLLCMLLGHLQFVDAFVYQRSRWQLDLLPLPCYLNTDSVPDTVNLDAFEQAVVNSLIAWNNASGMQLLQYAGRTHAPVALWDDGQNIISFVSEDWSGTVRGLSADERTVATICTWSVRQSIGDPPRHGISKNSFLRAFDIVLNAEKYPWSVGASPGRYDVQSVITHELGHVLGLGHVDVDHGEPQVPTMVDSVVPNTTKLRSLEPDDIAGVRSTYRRASGVLSGDESWQNMVWVSSSVLVPQGITLTIGHSPPQTVLHFAPGAELIVEGTLIIGNPASGSSKQILLTAAEETVWAGVRIHANDGVCQITDAILEKAEMALVLSSSTAITVEDSEFQMNQEAIRVDGGQDIHIRACSFDDTELAIGFHSTVDSRIEWCECRNSRLAVRLANVQNVSVEGVFQRNEVGVDVQSSREVIILGSTFEGNDTGLRITDTAIDIESSRFAENRIGIESRSTLPVLVRHSTLTRNEIGVHVLTGTIDLGRFPGDEGHNNLMDNTAWNIALANPQPTTIYAQGNHWGKLELGEIDQTNRDDDEDPVLPDIDVMPIEAERQSMPPGWVVEYLGITEEHASLGEPFPSFEGIVDGVYLQYSTGRFLSIGDARIAFEMMAIERDGTEYPITSVTSQGYGDINLWKGYDVHLQVLHSDIRSETVSVEACLSRDETHDFSGAAWLQQEAGNWRYLTRSLQSQGGGIRATFRLPDIAIEGESQAFYLSTRLSFDDGRAPLIVPGQWVTVHEDLPDLVGTIHEISGTVSPGDTVDIRYSIKNYGRVGEGTQKARFYLSESSRDAFLPAPDHMLSPTIQLSTLEGEWTSELTVPADVPLGMYYVWMLVDADNDIIERNGSNNPVTHLHEMLLVEPPEPGDGVAVESYGKRPQLWADLRTSLFQNYPNPFNPETWIPYQLAESGLVTITIHDAQGRLVRALSLGEQPGGIYQSKARAAYWNGCSEAGESVSSGTYYCTIQSGDFVATRRMLLLK